MKLIEPSEDCQCCYHGIAVGWPAKWFCNENHSPIENECEFYEREPGSDG